MRHYKCRCCGRVEYDAQITPCVACQNFDWVLIPNYGTEVQKTSDWAEKYTRTLWLVPNYLDGGYMLHTPGKEI